MQGKEGLHNLKSETAFYSSYVSEHKKKLFRRILSTRTRYITVLLEDIYQAQNASAVLRSCDGFGVQDVYVVENNNTFEVDKGVTIGAEKWLTVHKFNRPGQNNTTQAIKELKRRGYRILATTPHETACTLNEYEPKKPSALLFGAEKTGLSSRALELADQTLYIPMFGFSESFNLSVCAALCLYHMRMELKQIPASVWQLSQNEQDQLYLTWLKRSLKHRTALEKKYCELTSHKRKWGGIDSAERSEGTGGIRLQMKTDFR